MLMKNVPYGILQTGELGEVVYDATKYTDRYGLVLKVKPFTFDEKKQGEGQDEPFQKEIPFSNFIVVS